MLYAISLQRAVYKTLTYSLFHKWIKKGVKSFAHRYRTMLAPSPMIPPLNIETHEAICKVMINNASVERDGTRDPKSFPCSNFLDWKQHQNCSPFSTVKNTAFEAILKRVYYETLSVKQTFPRLSPSLTTHLHSRGQFVFHFA